MKNINKNKVVVEFLKDFEGSEKGNKKILPISIANDLKKDKIVKFLKDETQKLKENVEEMAINNKKEIDSLKKEIKNKIK